MTLEGLRLVEVPTIGDEGHDVDTWEDLRRLRGRED
jgi:CTP:molybdopterin cytidylyltransferase MocA